MYRKHHQSILIINFKMATAKRNYSVKSFQILNSPLTDVHVIVKMTKWIYIYENLPLTRISQWKHIGFWRHKTTLTMVFTWQWFILVSKMCRTLAAADVRTKNFPYSCNSTSLGIVTCICENMENILDKWQTPELPWSVEISNLRENLVKFPIKWNIR